MLEKTGGGKELRISVLYSHLTELGGAENVILTQLKLLRKKGHKVKCHFAYVDEHLTEKSENPHRFVENYLNLPLLKSESFNILLATPLAPFRASIFRGYDVLICHGYGPALWMGYVSKKMNGTKYVSYIHCPPRFLYLSREEKALWRFNKVRNLIYALSRVGWPIIKSVDFLSVVNSDGVLANSAFTAHRLKAIYGVEPTICYPPVDTDIFRPLKSRKIEELRSKFGWPLILSTGRIVAIKRWEWLIEAMTYVTKVYPSANLLITGGISSENIGYVKKLVKMAVSFKVQKNIKFLGFQPLNKLVQLYNAADVYAYAVPKEDFGLGPVEAMACGTPAVVWNDGAGPCETVIDAKTGFKAHPYDIEDFAEKILKAVDIEKSKIIDFACDYVKNNFSIHKHLDILESELKRI